MKHKDDYKHASKNIYLLKPSELRVQGVELNLMSRTNCYEHSDEHKGKTLEERQKIWDQLFSSIRSNGFSQEHPITLFLHRHKDQDKLGDGHHRLSIAIELGLPEVPVRLVW